MLGKLARQHDPNVLVGFDQADDAGVYQIAPDAALVQTVDFFTPIVDDPYTFGQIAAANSLSDIYAMGARPLTALALVCFPEKGDLQILERILAGGLSKMMEAGAELWQCPTQPNSVPVGSLWWAFSQSSTPDLLKADSYFWHGCRSALPHAE